MNIRFFKSLKSIGTAGLLWCLLAMATWLVDIAPAAAQSARDLKDTGAVGESLSGYLGLVKSVGADIQSAMDRINAARGQAYQEAAARSGRTVSEVEAVAGAQLRQKARAGDWVQNAAGQWVQVR